jgi:hypothetical protein
VPDGQHRCLAEHVHVEVEQLRDARDALAIREVAGNSERGLIDPPFCACVPLRLCVATSGTGNLIPCGSNSYATLEPASAVTLILVGDFTANGGTTTVSPALGSAKTPPNGPIVADVLTADLSGVFRSRGVTVTFVPRSEPRSNCDDAAGATTRSLDGAVTFSFAQPKANSAAVMVAVKLLIRRRRILANPLKWKPLEVGVKRSKPACCRACIKQCSCQDSTVL